MILLRWICWLRRIWYGGWESHTWEYTGTCEDQEILAEGQAIQNRHTTLKIATPSYRKDYVCRICRKRKHTYGWNDMKFISKEYAHDTVEDHRDME